MIAEPLSRGKGIASEAIELFKYYCMTVVVSSFPNKVFLTHFVAKIQSDNIPSRRLFEKCGFVKYKDVPVFNETEYRCINLCQ
jgi:RimJ/RimL family protein N-acetyltransferase